MKLSAALTGSVLFGTVSIGIGYSERECTEADQHIRSLDGRCNQLYGDINMGAAETAFKFEMGQHYDPQGSLYIFSTEKRGPSEPNNYAMDISSYLPPSMVCTPDTCEEIGVTKVYEGISPGMKGNPRGLSNALHSTMGKIKTEEEPGLSLLTTFILQYVVHDIFGAIKRSGIQMDMGGYPNMNDPNSAFVRTGIHLDHRDQLIYEVPGLAEMGVAYPTIGVSGPVVAEAGHDANGKPKMKFLNEKTSFADMDGIYGLGGELSHCIRSYSGGKLRLEDYEIEVDNGGSGYPTQTVRLRDLPPPTTCLPEDVIEEFYKLDVNRATAHITPLYGDLRNTENVALGVVHLAFVRLHNQLTESDFCNAINNDEDRFQCARRLNIAIYQHIVFGELMETLVGRNLNDEYEGYDGALDASLMAEADICARFHFSVPWGIPLADEDCDLLTDYAPPPLRGMDWQGDPQPGWIPFAGVRFNQYPIGAFPVILGSPSLATGHDPFHQLIRGLTCFNAPKYNEEVDNIIRSQPTPPAGVDVPAHAYARIQQLGIAPFLEVHERMAHGKIYGEEGCPSSYRDDATLEDPLSCFTMITGDEDKARRLMDGLRYGGIVPKVKNIPLFAGIVYEKKTGGSHLGTTQTAVIVEQMRRSRDADRFYYLNDLNENEINFVHQFNMNIVLRRAFGNKALSKLPRFVFQGVGSADNNDPTYSQYEAAKVEGMGADLDY
jgi:Animal haem peroxidase